MICYLNDKQMKIKLFILISCKIYFERELL